MFYDEVMAAFPWMPKTVMSSNRRKYANVASIHAQMRYCEKFQLSDDTLFMAHTIIQSGREKVAPALGFSKWPYPNMWVEHKSTRGDTGYLILQGRACIFTFMPNRSGGEDGLYRVVNGGLLYFVPYMIPTHLSFDPVLHYETLLPGYDGELSVETLESLSLFRNELLGIGILLNLRNGTKQEVVSRGTENASCAGIQGDTYNIITPDLGPGGDSNGGTGNGTPKRQHLQRGHFKTLKKGVSWWNPHVRGRNTEGNVTKHYQAGV